MSQIDIHRGDTLLEVVLAFVMFSLVTAISVAVMNSSLSGAEAALELTLARTEIDAQAETLRFIQDGFAKDRAYKNLWNEIIKRVPGNNTELPSLSVASCDTLYNPVNPSTVYSANAFVVNPRRIGNNTDSQKEDYLGYTLIKADSSDVRFFAASLNPRLVYGKKESGITDIDETTDAELKEVSPYTYVARAEGIYDFVMPATDKGGQSVAYSYDFYIYTCWYPPGAELPTTIGTVIRLYNPEFFDK